MSRAASEAPISKNHSVTPGFSTANPFDSDSESETESRHSRAYSDPPTIKENPEKSSYMEAEKDREASSASHMSFTDAENRKRNVLCESREFDNHTLQELENHAGYKADKTTQTVDNCLKIAVDIREDAIRTLTTLDQQSEQITRTHQVAADMDHDLSRAEKLLGSLGGFFSKTWKPKIGRPIKGPILFRDIFSERKGNNLEQRERMELSSTSSKGQSNTQLKCSEPASAPEKIELEKAKQDDKLSDLSNLLGQLKEMAVDMGTEIGRHNKALEHMQNDVDELNIRVKGSNQRGRQLLGK